MYDLTMFLIFVLVTETVGQASVDYSINVGTVLFSPSDLHNHQWTANEISLLKARRHFQDALPPPNFIDTSNEDYVNILLNYFKNAFSTIKREATCPISDNLMTLAFADALGGYLKLWVLPISKLAFYGGTVSQGNINKLHQFNNEIKKFMETDGRGWRSPDENVLNSITVNIVPPAHIMRSIRNACEHFAYYEKSDVGFSIPTPYIDWGDTSGTMFLPLRNESLIPLNSPNFPNALLKYYDAAKNCIDSGNSAQNNEFDDRFQTWLTTNVVPHLSDDNVYLPLGSVLSLVNKSREMCDKVMQLSNTKPKAPHSHYVIAGIPIDLTSKKTLFIIIILFLEIAWCIPALFYLLISRRKKQKEGSKKFYTLLNAGRNRKNDNDKDRKSFKNKPKKNSTIYRGFKIGNRPRSGNVELETQFIPSNSKETMATDTHSYIGSEVCSTVSVIHETMPTPPLKSSMKKVRSREPHLKQHTIAIEPSKPRSFSSHKKPEECVAPTRELSIRTESYTIDHTTDPSTTFSSVKQIDSTVKTISNSTHVQSSNKDIEKAISKEVSLQQCLTEEMPAECPCLNCLEAEVGSEITIVNQESMPHPICSDKNVEINMLPIYPLIDQAKCVKKMKNFGLRLESGRPYLEIKIAKPQAEISVGIGATFDPLKMSRRSKIPKRLPKTTAAQMASGTSPMIKDANANRNKSLIPQPKRRPVDDLFIKSSKPKQKRKDDKLNVTL